MDPNRRTLYEAMRRMGEPSWLILHVLDPSDAIPAIEIVRRVEGVLERAEYPHRHLDPSTTHYALRRMQSDGLIVCEGERLVEVPGPRGSSRLEMRPLYVISPLGTEALAARDRLDALTVSRRRRLLSPSTSNMNAT